MAAQDLEQLSVNIGARIDDFKKGMQQAVREFDTSANAIDQKNRQLTQRMSDDMNQISINTRGAGAAFKYLSGALQGVFYVAAIVKFIDAVKDANKELSDLGKKADDTRISAQNIAGLRFAGIGEGASTKEIDAALDHFTEQSKKTQEDAKGLYKALSQIDPAFAAAFKSAGSQTERLNILSKAFNATANETKKAQLSVNAFGTDNERVIRTVESAGGNLSTLADRARAAGISIDTDLTKKAEEAQKQLDLLAEVSGNKLKVAFSNLVPILVYVAEFMGKMGTAIGLIYDTAAKMAALRAGPTEVAHIQRPYTVSPDGTIHYDTEVLTPGGGPLPFEGPMPSRRPKGTGGSGGSAFEGRESLGKTGSEKLDELERAEKTLKKQTVALDAQAAALGKVGTEAAFLEAQTRLLETAQEAGIKVTDEQREEIDKLSMAYAKASEHLKEMKLDRDLAFERSQVFRTSDEQAIATRTRGLDPDKAERVAKSMREIQNLTEGKEMAGSFVKGLVSDLENGVRAGQALENQLKRIADKLADKAIDSLISGLFGGASRLFGGGGMSLAAGELGQPGPGFAAYEASLHSQGGWAGRGPLVNIPASTFIGAKHFAAGGGIPAILHAGEIVLNQAQQKNVAQGLGPPSKPISITHAPTINGAGMTPEQVFGLVTRSQKEFARNILPIFTNAQRRYG